eukprot:scaffold283546_cov40-Prasinocladus_malaysianus.AAC.1
MVSTPAVTSFYAGNGEQPSMGSSAYYPSNGPGRMQMASTRTSVPVPSYAPVVPGKSSGPRKSVSVAPAAAAAATTPAAFPSSDLARRPECVGVFQSCH